MSCRNTAHNATRLASRLASSSSSPSSLSSSKLVNSSLVNPIRKHTHLRAYSTASGLTVNPISGALGAEILNVDLSRPLSSELTSTIRQALLDHQVIFFRDQHLSPSTYLSFAAHFGKPIEYPFVKGIDGFPEVINVLKREHETSNFGGIWHSDTTYLPCPPMGSVLLALEVPPHGGDTLFASQYLAFDGLSPGLQTTLSALRAVSTSAKADVSRTREDRVKDAGRASETLEAAHPAVRTHPETGRRALYVNVAHTSRFEGWSEEESAPLLRFLFQHQVRPEFTCRFRWRKGSVAFWDNRCALHNPVNDYHGFRRSMWRITLEGDTPR